jgi:RNA polymerase sigma-70 factor (ECF subfamily)
MARPRRPAQQAAPPASEAEREERVAAATDRPAFSALYEAHAPRIYRYLLHRTSSPAEAEELTSRTFLQALAGLDQYRGRGEFGAWLMGIAHHLLLNWYRAKGRRPTTDSLDAAIEVPSDIPGPAESLERNEAISRVRAAVSALAPERQQLIALKYVDGRSNAEVADIMGRTEGAVKALHHRTLRELQRLLDHPEDPPRERTTR